MLSNFQGWSIDGFRQRQVAFPAQFWWSRFACLWSKAKTSLLVDSGPALIRFCSVTMQTTNWEECPQSVHYDNYSLESRAIVNAWNDRQSSDASSDIEHFQEMETWKLLLRDQEIHILEDYKSSNCSSCSYLHIATYSSYLMRLQAPKRAALKCIPLRECPTSTLLGRRFQSPSCLWL